MRKGEHGEPLWAKEDIVTCNAHNCVVAFKSIRNATIAQHGVNAMDGLRAEWVQEVKANIARLDGFCERCELRNEISKACAGCAIRELKTLAQEGE